MTAPEIILLWPAYIVIMLHVSFLRHEILCDCQATWQKHTPCDGAEWNCVSPGAQLGYSPQSPACSLSPHNFYWLWWSGALEIQALVYRNC